MYFQKQKEKRKPNTVLIERESRIYPNGIQDLFNVHFNILALHVKVHNYMLE